MAEKQIDTRQLDEQMRLMQHFPTKFKELQKLGMSASMMALWESVPSYPPPPGTSTYRRTGTLGRTLGSSESGGKSGGKPQIYEVKGIGTLMVQGRLGTRLGYADYVIGEGQAKHMRHWWKLEVVLERASDKIGKVWDEISGKIKQYLESRGGV